MANRKDPAIEQALRVIAGTDGGQGSEPNGGSRPAESGTSDAIGGIGGTQEKPAEAANPESFSSGEAPKKRGRPFGSKNGARAPSQAGQGLDGELKPVDQKAARNQIQALHHMLATVSGSKRFELNDGQAQVMGDAIAEFSKFFPVVPTGKNGAIFGLVAACAMVYTLIMIGLGADAKAAKQAQRQQDPLMPATPEAAVPPVRGGAYSFAGI